MPPGEKFYGKTKQTFNYLATMTRCVWTSKGEAFTPKNTLPSSMVVAFFAASGSGTLHKMDLIMVEIWTQFRPIEQ